MTPAQQVALDAMRSAWDEATVARMLEARDPRALLREHVSLLGAALRRIEEDRDAYGTHYGSWMGGDPRDFTPDPECSEPHEREAHRLASEAAERDEPGARDLRPRTEVGGVLCQDQRFGLGTTVWGDEESDRMIAEFRALIGLPVDPR